VVYEDFLERIKNPVTKCLLHDEAVSAAELLDMWRGVAQTLYSAIVEGAGGSGMEAYDWGVAEEQKIINTRSTQGEI
jgi:hypothetical protein